MWLLIWLLMVGVFCVDVHSLDVTSKSTNNVGQDKNVKLRRDKRYSRIADLVVNTEYGSVRGIVENEIIHFFDIPYGNFSVENPFQGPVEPLPWATTLENTEHASRCPQVDSENNYIGNTECLTLSVFVPNNAENADVLFHIHDNTLNISSGDPMKYSPRHFVNRGIILVLPNYRIGPLGFLCLQNESVPGNAGLKDLQLALQWTKNNIKNFGGNDSNIVISGSGFAGALVQYLILSNNTRPLISKAIVESGFALSPWALDRNPLKTGERLKENMRSSANLQHHSQYFIFNSLEQLVKAGQGLNFLPCIENENGFLTKTPWHLLNNEKIDVTIMAGSANQAAIDTALAYTSDDIEQINYNFSLLLPNDLKFDSVEEKNTIGTQIRRQYFGEINITINDMERLSRCYSDNQYLYPGLREARLLVKGGAEVYFYEFSYGSHHSINGSVRGDILNYVFNANENPAENSFQNTLLNLWNSFIRLGKPSIAGIDWTNLETANENEEVWLSIGANVLVRRGYHQRRLKLWNDIYQQHFVERNRAIKLNSSDYVALVAFMLLLDTSFNFKF